MQYLRDANVAWTSDANAYLYRVGGWLEEVEP